MYKQSFRITKDQQIQLSLKEQRKKEEDEKRSRVYEAYRRVFESKLAISFFTVVFNAILFVALFESDKIMEFLYTTIIVTVVLFFVGFLPELCIDENKKNTDIRQFNVRVLISSGVYLIVLIIAVIVWVCLAVKSETDKIIFALATIPIGVAFISFSILFGRYVRIYRREFPNTSTTNVNLKFKQQLLRFVY